MSVCEILSLLDSTEKKLIQQHEIEIEESKEIDSKFSVQQVTDDK